MLTPPSREWVDTAVSPAGAVSLVKSGDKVFIQGACATPTPLLEALVARTDLEGVSIYHLHMDGPIDFGDPELEGRFVSNSLFCGGPLRAAVNEGRANYIPIFLSDIPRLFDRRTIDLDAALIQLSPPDKHGHCTLGVSVDCTLAAARNARIVVAEINERMPRSCGHSSVPFSRLSSHVHTNRPLHESPPRRQTEVEQEIGEIIAAMIEDGSTLQMGIGAIPDAVLARLGNKVDLGVHTEMFSDGLIDLVQGGVVTNRFKAIHGGRTTTSFAAGTKRLFDFVDDNLQVEFHPCDRTNDTALIRKNPKVVAINSAIEVDLSGQVCADSIGLRIFSGIGGQMDFIHGAALSEGGKPVIAMPSTAAHGKVSRIMPTLQPGAGVVTTRGHVHWVVTEYGAVNLHGLTLRERGRALISIAHPDFRRSLRKELDQTRHIRMGSGQFPAVGIPDGG